LLILGDLEQIHNILNARQSRLVTPARMAGVERIVWRMRHKLLNMSCKAIAAAPTAEQSGHERKT
jgi:hypothetical protein